MHTLFYLAVSFLASIAGAICGIGGGVIIKPVLDLFGLEQCRHHQLPVRLHGAFHELLFCGKVHACR